MKGSLNHPKKVTKNYQVCIFWCWNRTRVYIRCGPLPVTVTTRIITFLVEESYTSLFATVTGRGPHPKYINNIIIYIYMQHAGQVDLPIWCEQNPNHYHSYCCCLESCTSQKMMEHVGKCCSTYH